MFTRLLIIAAIASLAACAQRPGKPITIVSPHQCRLDNHYTVYFNYRSAQIDSAARAVLEDAYHCIHDRPPTDYYVILSGYSDAVGTPQSNMLSSRKRADAVRDAMVDMGLDEERITIHAFGEQNPAVPTLRGIANMMNRRRGNLRGRTDERLTALRFKQRLYGFGRFDFAA